MTGIVISGNFNFMFESVTFGNSIARVAKRNVIATVENIAVCLIRYILIGSFINR